MNLFQQLGLSDNETQVLQYLYTVDSATIKDICMHTTVARTTIYPVSDSLQKKKLIEEVQVNNKTHLQAHSPYTLYNLLDAQQKEIKKTERALDSTVTRLVRDQSQLHSSPTTIHYTQSNINSLFEKIKVDITNKDEIVKVIWDPEKAHNVEATYVYSTELEKLHSKSIYRIIPDTIFNRDYANWLKTNSSNSNTKLVNPSLLTIENDILIRYNSVIFLDYYSEQLVGVEIKNSNLQHTMDSMFNLMWKSFQ